MNPAWLAVADDSEMGGVDPAFQSERPVWTMGVVVGGVDPQDLLKVASSDDQQPVQALRADGADPALPVGVRVGCLHRRQEHLGTLRTEDVVAPAGELHVPMNVLAAGRHQARRQDRVGLHQSLELRATLDG
jgi:hypothetical protein